MLPIFIHFSLCVRLFSPVIPFSASCAACELFREEGAAIPLVFFVLPRDFNILVLFFSGAVPATPGP